MAEQPAAALRVLATGPGTTVQDLGRPGLTAWGVPRSGAADRAALRRANRLVGNPEGAAGLECLLGGLDLVPDRPVVVAVTGAQAPVRVDDRAPGPEAAVLVPAGGRLSIGLPRSGLRAYLAVRGGLDVDPVLGARCWDSLGRFGPPPLQVGDVLRTAPARAGAAWFEPVPVRPRPAGPLVVRVVLGPRDDVLTDRGRANLFTTAWTVDPASDRVGLRLAGPALDRRTAEIPSEPMLPGCVQVPADGRPIVLGPDCGTTGGYPVVAVVVEADLDALGQLRPGEQVRFRPARVG